MNAVVRLLLPAASLPLLAFALAACGASPPEPAVATTRTTSSALTVRPQPDGEKEALRKRTEEQAALLDEERQTRQVIFDRQRENAATKREQDELAVKIAESIENADLALDSARDAAVKDGWRKWPQVEKATKTAQRHKAKLLTDLRRLHGDLGMMSWSTFKEDAERSIGDLEQATSQARAMTEVTATKPVSGGR